MRFSHSSIATRISILARFEPAQRWMPTPKAMCGLTLRSRITSSGFSNFCGSRLAAGKFIRTLSFSFIGQPLYSASLVTSRAIVTGE